MPVPESGGDEIERREDVSSELGETLGDTGAACTECQDMEPGWDQFSFQGGGITRPSHFPTATPL